jgi:Mg2+/Co2+ transporter CorC
VLLLLEDNTDRFNIKKSSVQPPAYENQSTYNVLLKVSCHAQSHSVIDEYGGNVSGLVTIEDVLE